MVFQQGPLLYRSLLLCNDGWQPYLVQHYKTSSSLVVVLDTCMDGSALTYMYPYVYIFCLENIRQSKMQWFTSGWHQQPVWNWNVNVFTAGRGGALSVVKCQACSLKAQQSEQPGICMIVTATRGLWQNEPSLTQNSQAKSRADLSRHVDAGVDFSLLRNPQRSQCEEPRGIPILSSWAQSLKLGWMSSV